MSAPGINLNDPQSIIQAWQILNINPMFEVTLANVEQSYASHMQPLAAQKTRLTTELRQLRFFQGNKKRSINANIIAIGSQIADLSIVRQAAIHPFSAGNEQLMNAARTEFLRSALSEATHHQRQLGSQLQQAHGQLQAVHAELEAHRSGAASNGNQPPDGDVAPDEEVPSSKSNTLRTMRRASAAILGATAGGYGAFASTTAIGLPTAAVAGVTAVSAFLTYRIIDSILKAVGKARNHKRKLAIAAIALTAIAGVAAYNNNLTPLDLGKTASRFGQTARSIVGGFVPFIDAQSDPVLSAGRGPSIPVTTTSPDEKIIQEAKANKYQRQNWTVHAATVTDGAGNTKYNLSEGWRVAIGKFDADKGLLVTFRTTDGKTGWGYIDPAKKVLISQLKEGASLEGPGRPAKNEFASISTSFNYKA